MRSAAELRLLAARTLSVLVATATLAFFLFLPFAGRFLDDDDPLEPADLILVLAGARVERWLEGADLYKEGWAPRIVVSPGPVDPIEAELAARGIVYPREGDLAREAIIATGVPADAVAVLPDGVDNTAHEAVALLRAAEGRPLRRVIVVTSPYHTRRTGFAFRRAFAGTGVEVRVRGSRYSRADPERKWWRQRSDIRYVTSELPKLVLYAVGVAE